MTARIARRLLLTAVVAATGLFPTTAAGQSTRAPDGYAALPIAPANQRDSGSVPEAELRAVVRSFETAAISAEINARITTLPLREGDRFRKGETLVAFDCRRLVAEEQAAAAAYDISRAVFESVQVQARYAAAGTLSVDQARFERDRAQAEWRVLMARRAACTIEAPFDGRVIEKMAQLHEIAQPNQPLIRILNEEKLELVLIVPSSQLTRVASGTPLSVRIDETGETLAARILQETGAIDPVSQSSRVIAVFEEKSSRVLPGMSGTVTVREGEVGP